MTKNDSFYKAGGTAICLAIVFFVFINWFPYFHSWDTIFFSIVLFIVGILSLSAPRFLKRINPFEEYFINCKIKGGDTIPQFRYKKHYDNKTVYHFTLPPGLSTSDIKVHKERLEQGLNHPISIMYEDEGFRVELFDKFYEENSSNVERD